MYTHELMIVKLLDAAVAPKTVLCVLSLINQAVRTNLHPWRELRSFKQTKKVRALPSTFGS